MKGRLALHLPLQERPVSSSHKHVLTSPSGSFMSAAGVQNGKNSGQTANLENRLCSNDHLKCRHLLALEAILAQTLHCASVQGVIASVCMGRRGWKSLDTPTGWVQIIRGPRPPSVQWPRVGQQSRQLVQHGPRQSPTNRPTSVQAKSSGLRPFPDPKNVSPNWRPALSAMDGMEGPDVDMVRNAYKRALEAVRGTPIDVQVKECESFLARARSIWSSWIPSVRPSSRTSSHPRRGWRTDASSEVHQLRGRVAQLQAQVDSFRTVPSVDCQGPNPKRTCRREEFVPQCDEEMREWIEGRQRDLQAPFWPGNSQRWRGSPNSCPRQRKSGNRSSKSRPQGCRLQWRTW